MRDLYEIIKNCKKGNCNDIEYVLNKFQPLINKYARLLDCEYDDAKQELSLELINVIQKIPINKENFGEDKYCIGYIKKSIIHKYFAMSKKLSMKYSYEYDIDFNLIPAKDEVYVIELYDLLKDLSNIEKSVVILKYINNMTDAEIGEIRGISRQAINQAKNRAIRKLKKCI